MRLFWSGFVLSLSLCMDLGLVNVTAMRVGVQHGLWASLQLQVGSCCGDLVYAAAALFGVGAVVMIPTVRWVLWIGGSLALVWFAAVSLRDAWRARLPVANRDSAVARKHPAAYFLQGFGLALASPSAILWFASIGGAVIATSASHSAASAWLFFSGFFISGLCWSVFIALVSAQGRKLGTGFVRGFALTAAALFAALAIKVFLDGYRTFVSAR